MGNMCALAPYRVEGATFHGFVLDSSYDRLNELLDEQLGALTGGALRFAALLPVVFVTYVSIARSLSLSTDPADAGVYVENDLMCWLLVAQFSGEAIVPERTGFYAPLVWVDHPVALVEGRETFGYPKGFGTISIPTADAPPVYACDAFTFPGAATLPVTPQRVSTVRGPAGGGAPATRWTSVGALREAILRELADTPDGHRFAADLAPLNLLEQFAFAPFQTFLLRQMSSASDPGQAVRQEIVASPFASLAFHGASLRSGAWTAEFPALPTADVAAFLGVATVGPVRLAYVVSLDTTLAPATTLWSWPPAAVNAPVPRVR